MAKNDIPDDGETQDQEDLETSASTWQQRFENRKIKQRQMFEDAGKYYDIMYSVQNIDKISPWKSKVYVPVLASKAWDLIARMSDVVPLFDVTIKNELILDDVGNFTLDQGVEQREERIEAKLQYDYLCGHDEPMKLKVFDPLVDAVVAGTGYAYAPWCFEDKTAKARQFDEAGTMDNESEVTKTTSTGYNGFEPINYFNVFPGDGPSWFKIPYLIVRGYKPKVDMEISGLYENLDACDVGPKQPVDEFTLYNQSRDRVVNEMDAISADETVDMITYYECYERTAEGITLTTYAEGLASEVTGEQEEPSDAHPWIEIRETSVPYWHNMYPVVPFYCRRKSFSPFGESLFENNRTLQSATNDLFNHYLDNWNLSIESMLMYEDGTLTNDFIIEPGGEITFTGEPPKQFKFPEPNPTQLSLVMGVLEKGIDNATFSPYAAGTPNDPSDKTRGTAYGVKTITEAATTKIGFFRDNFKQSMKIVGRIWLSNLQQFSDDPAEIRRTQNGKVVPDVVLPSDYQGEMELDIDDDSMTPLSKADKLDANDRFTQGILTLQKAAIQQAEIFKTPQDIPRLNFLELSENYAELYSQKDFSRYLLDNTIQQPQTGDQPNFRDTPAGVALDGIAKNIAKMDPDTQAQVEKVANLQPSALTPANVAHHAIQQGAEQAQILNGDPTGGKLNAANQPAIAGPSAGGTPTPQVGATA